MKKLSFFHKIIFIINILFTVFWVISFLAPYIDPDSFTITSLLGISYPIILLFHILFIFYWMMKIKKVIFLSLIVVLLSYLFATPIFKFKNKFKALAKDNSFSILSLNCQMGYFLGGSKKNVQECKSKIIHFLNQENSDILCIQEGRKEFKNQLKYPFKSIFESNHIYSKYRIIDSKEFTFSESSSNKSSYADIIIHDDTVRIYNLHLESLHLKKETNEIQSEWEKEIIDFPIKKNTQIISNIIKRATKKRINQTISIFNSIQDSPYPTLLCGDFNEVSQSYVYRKLLQGHNDAFIACGSGFGTTFRQFLFPIRIDYILADKKWSAYNFEIMEERISDHQPIRCDIEIN